MELKVILFGEARSLLGTRRHGGSLPRINDACADDQQHEQDENTDHTAQDAEERKHVNGNRSGAAFHGCGIRAAAQAQQGFLAAIDSQAAPPLAIQGTKAFGRLVAYLGAGIYEELLFRAMLFPAIAAMLRLVGTPGRTSWIVAIFVSSLAFSAAHYQLDLMIGNFHLVTSYGDSFEWTSFLFRLGAGLFFSTLLLARGFGITAGAHAFYDILVSIPA